MMNRRTIRIFAIGLLSVFALNASANDDDTKESLFNPVNYAVISQTIAPDARGGGLGDVGAATDPDVNSQYWNPAKYPFNISRAGVALNFTPWLRSLVNDMNLAYLSGYYRIGDYSAVSASLRYFNMGEVFTQDPNENANDMTINPYEMSLDVAYSMMLSEKFSLAAAIRWIYSDLRFDYTEENSPASAFAADIAAYYQNYINIGQRECQLGVGLNISNIGSKITLTCGSYRLDAVPKFYTLYPLSIPFIVLGFIGAVYSFLVSLYKRTFQADSIYLLFFLSGLITIGLSGSGYVYRANSFFICYLFFLIKGLFLCCRFLSSYHTGFMLLLSAGYLLWCISFCSFYFRVYTMTDVCPNYLYSISFRECVDDVNLNLDYADLYVDLVNMKEFFFFYYPASPYDTQDEETFTDGIHTYHFLTDYSTKISPSSVYVVYKKNNEFLQNLSESGLAYQTWEYPYYYVIYFE